MDYEYECNNLDGDIETSDEMLILVSTNGTRFQVSKKNARISKVLTSAIENSTDSEPIPLNVETRVLERIVEYMNIHEGAEAPLPTRRTMMTKNPREYCVDPRDAEFFCAIRKKRRFFYDFTNFAYYLDIPNLHFMCKQIVSSFFIKVPISKIPEVAFVDSASDEEEKTDD